MQRPWSTVVLLLTENADVLKWLTCAHQSKPRLSQTGPKHVCPHVPSFAGGFGRSFVKRTLGAHVQSAPLAPSDPRILEALPVIDDNRAEEAKTYVGCVPRSRYLYKNTSADLITTSAYQLTLNCRAIDFAVESTSHRGSPHSPPPLPPNTIYADKQQQHHQ